MISTIFDITKDPYFIEGNEKGIEKNKYDVALNMIYKNYTDEQVVDILNLDIST